MRPPRKIEVILSEKKIQQQTDKTMEHNVGQEGRERASADKAASHFPCGDLTAMACRFCGSPERTATCVFVSLQ